MSLFIFAHIQLHYYFMQAFCITFGAFVICPTLCNMSDTQMRKTHISFLYMIFIMTCNMNYISSKNDGLRLMFTF